MSTRHFVRQTKTRSRWRARFYHTTANSTCGCNNNICQRILDQTYADYTREAVLWATSLTKVEGERPRTFDRVKLVTVDELFRFFLRHRIRFADDLH